MSKASATEEIFFNASSAASLEIFKKNGKIPVAVSALVKNKKGYDLVPVGAGLPEMDVRMAQTVLDFALKPLVSHINDNTGSAPVVFFLSVTAQGMVRDLGNGDTEEVNVIINAARNHEKRGKTNTFKISDGAFIKLTAPEDDIWREDPENDGLPSSLAQGLLDMVWKSFIVSKNMSMIGV